MSRPGRRHGELRGLRSALLRLCACRERASTYLWADGHTHFWAYTDTHHIQKEMLLSVHGKLRKAQRPSELPPCPPRAAWVCTSRCGGTRCPLDARRHTKATACADDLAPGSWATRRMDGGGRACFSGHAALWRAGVCPIKPSNSLVVTSDPLHAYRRPVGRRDLPHPAAMPAAPPTRPS